MDIKREVTGLLAGAAPTVGALFATAAPAQAYSPNPYPYQHTYDTDNCPCSGGNLTDPFDGTYFEHDPDGRAQKIELYDGDWFVGKVEFHPNGDRSLEVDWIFGSATKSALQYAQGEEGISKDGVYGKDSRTNLLWEFSRGGAHHCVRL